MRAIAEFLQEILKLFKTQIIQAFGRSPEARNIAVLVILLIILAWVVEWARRKKRLDSEETFTIRVRRLLVRYFCLTLIVSVLNYDQDYWSLGLLIATIRDLTFFIPLIVFGAARWRPLLFLLFVLNLMLSWHFLSFYAL